jgi:hypothetical protein
MEKILSCYNMILYDKIQVNSTLFAELYNDVYKFCVMYKQKKNYKILIDNVYLILNSYVENLEFENKNIFEIHSMYEDYKRKVKKLKDISNYALRWNETYTIEDFINIFINKIQIKKEFILESLIFNWHHFDKFELFIHECFPKIMKIKKDIDNYNNLFLFCNSSDVVDKIDEEKLFYQEIILKFL